MSRALTFTALLVLAAFAPLSAAPTAEAYTYSARSDSIRSSLGGFEPPGSPTCQISSALRDGDMATFRDFSPSSGSNADAECWGTFGTDRTIKGAAFAIGCQSGFDTSKCRMEVKFCPSTATSSSSTGCVVAFTHDASNNQVYARANPPPGGWTNVRFVILKPCACASPPTERVYDMDFWTGADVLNSANLDDNLDNLLNFTKARSNALTANTDTPANAYPTVCATNPGDNQTNCPGGLTGNYFFAGSFDISGVRRQLQAGTYVAYIDATSSGSPPPRVLGMGGHSGNATGFWDNANGNYNGVSEVVILKQTATATRLQALVMFTLKQPDTPVVHVTAASTWGFRYFDVGSSTGKAAAHMFGETLWMGQAIITQTTPPAYVTTASSGRTSKYFAPIFEANDFVYKRPEKEFFDLSVGDHVAFTPDTRFGFTAGTAGGFSLTLPANSYYGNTIYAYLLEKGASSTQVLSLLVNGKQAPVIKTIITSDSVGQVFLIETCKTVCFNGAARTYTMSISNYRDESKLYFAKWTSTVYGAVHTANTAQMNVGLYQDGGGIFSAYTTTIGVFYEPAKATFKFLSKNDTTKAVTALKGAALYYLHNASGYARTLQNGPTESWMNVTGLTGAYTVVGTADDHYSMRQFYTFQPGFVYTITVTLSAINYGGTLGTSELEWQSGAEGGTAAGVIIMFGCSVCTANIPAKIEINITRNIEYDLFVGVDRVDPVSGIITHNVVVPDFWARTEFNTYAFRFPPRAVSGPEHAGAYFVWTMNETGVILAAKKFFLVKTGESWEQYDYALTDDLVDAAENPGADAARESFLDESRTSLLENERLLRNKIHDDMQAVSDYGWYFIALLLILACVRAFRR